MEMTTEEDTESICEHVPRNGDAYAGNFKAHLPHGMGKYTWLDGTTYDGEWVNSRITGKGHIIWQSGATYLGDLSGGFLHGYGTYTGIDGSVYEGSWRMNIQHGLGRKRYSNSEFYDGSWSEGLQEGEGRYVWSNGNSYIGNWKAGKMFGKGLMKWENGDTYEGLWFDGLLHGHGCYKFADGSYYVGTWTKGLKDGSGNFYPVGLKHHSQLDLPESLKYCKELPIFPSSTSLTPNLHEHKNLCSSIMCCKWSSSGFLRRSGRISHTSMSVDRVWNSGEIGENSTHSRYAERSSSSKCQSSAVFERQYVQGVLVVEKRVYSSCHNLYNGKWKHRFYREVPRRLCETIIEGDRSYYLMLDLQLGIRYTVGKITPVPKREVRSSDFGTRARIRMKFPRRGSEFTPPHYSIGFFWKDYCPMVFRNLREMFKIDAADYMVSICGTDGLKELSSPGKSGSIFYLSQDERFVLKTLKKPELKVLLKMLPYYYHHVKAYENTLITKFFGLHRITLRGGSKVRFVVMGNMFCTELRIHCRYDLKGSSQGRSTFKTKTDENTTMKDLDLSYVFQLEKSWRDAMFRQIYLDCAFLESQHIIDYSLLLGLHFRAPEYLTPTIESEDLKPTLSSLLADDGDLVVPSKRLLLVTHNPETVSAVTGSHVRGSTLRASAIGGEEADLLLPESGRLRVQLGVNMPARANHKVLHEELSSSATVDLFEVYDVVLYFGIIDILQEYNMTKKMEHACKSLKFDPLTISAVAPHLYSRRFINFLEKVFL